jgi:hypothetical protein
MLISMALRAKDSKGDFAALLVSAKQQKLGYDE